MNLPLSFFINNDLNQFLCSLKVFCFYWFLYLKCLLFFWAPQFFNSIIAIRFLLSKQISNNLLRENLFYNLEFRYFFCIGYFRHHPRIRSWGAVNCRLGCGICCSRCVYILFCTVSSRCCSRWDIAVFSYFCAGISHGISEYCITYDVTDCFDQKYRIGIYWSTIRFFVRLLHGGLIIFNVYGFSSRRWQNCQLN